MIVCIIAGSSVKPSIPLERAPQRLGIDVAAALVREHLPQELLEVLGCRVVVCHVARPLSTSVAVASTLVTGFCARTDAGRSVYAARERRRNAVDRTRSGKLGLGVWALNRRAPRAGRADVPSVALRDPATGAGVRHPRHREGCRRRAGAADQRRGRRDVRDRGDSGPHDGAGRGQPRAHTQLVRARPGVDGFVQGGRPPRLGVPPGGDERAARRAQRHADGRLPARGDSGRVERARIRHRRRGRRGGGRGGFPGRRHPRSR